MEQTDPRHPMQGHNKIQQYFHIELRFKVIIIDQNKIMLYPQHFHN